MDDASLFGSDWSAYYDAVSHQPPRHTLVRTLSLIDNEQRSLGQGLQYGKKLLEEMPLAVDLGCGDGRDTVLLLERGWRVLAIDAQTEAIHRLKQRLPDRSDTLQTRVCPFEKVLLPSNVQLINASFSLPFCHPDAFLDLWQKIIHALVDQGWFCGQLFGDRDGWAGYTEVLSYSRQEVVDLLTPFDVIELEEAEHSGLTAMGDIKNWHLFHIIARKKIEKSIFLKDFDR